MGWSVSVLQILRSLSIVTRENSSSGQGNPLYMTSGDTSSTTSRASCLHASFDCSLRSISVWRKIASPLFTGQWQSLNKTDTHKKMFVWISLSANWSSRGTERFPAPMMPAWKTVDAPKGCVGIEPNFKFSSKRHFALADLDGSEVENFPPKILANGVEIAPSSRSLKTIVSPPGFKAIRDRIFWHWNA